MSLYGGIEAGGTKFVCAVGFNPEDLRDKTRFDTTSPDKTIYRAIEYFREQSIKERLLAIGIGSFGPVDLNRESSTYGYITSTPKPNWYLYNNYNYKRVSSTGSFLCSLGSTRIPFSYILAFIS